MQVKTLVIPKPGPKRTVSVIAFRIAVTLDVKIVCFGWPVAVGVNKRHKNAIFGCTWFQKFNFPCLLIKLLIKTENIFSFVCPLQSQSPVMISGTQLFFTILLTSSHKL